MTNIKDDYIEEFTDIEILELLIEYISRYFKLTKGKNVKLEGDTDLNITCKDKDTMKVISKLTLDELLNSCNSVECDDELFNDTFEIVDTLNSKLNGELFDRLSEEIWNKFNINCTII
ncbi:MAG: hypothetical protein IJH34_13945 [Romboutsia sp.]|nr:hypothetical protein [Romboutsia sp.]